MGKVYSFGCSHTAGIPDIGSGTPTQHRERVDYWKSKTYPHYVAEEFGLENINLAVPGSSHKDVYRKFFTTLPKISTDDIVLLQPTFPHRREIHLMHYDAPTPVQATDIIIDNPVWVTHLMKRTGIPHKYLPNFREAVYYMLMGDWVLLDSLVTLYTAMELLESKKIKYIISGYFQYNQMVHILKEDFGETSQEYKELVRLQKNYNKDPINYGSYIDVLGLVDKLNLNKIEVGAWPESWGEDKLQEYLIPNDGHWNEKGHKYQANRLIKKIRKLY